MRAIRQRHADRQPLNITAVKRDDPKLVQSVYEQSPYWGWKAALAEAGLTYSTIRIEIEQSVVCRLCGRRFSALGGHLNTVHFVEGSDYLEEFPGAELTRGPFKTIKMVQTFSG